VPEHASSSSASPNIEKPAATETPDIPSASHTTSPAPASSPAPEKTSSPAKDDPPPEQDDSATEVHMDSGAQQETSDTGAPASGAGTAEDAGAGDMSAGIDNKGKGPAVLEVWTIPAPASAGQAAAPEQPAPKTPTTEKTSSPAQTAAPAKTSAPVKPSVPTYKLDPSFKS
jgi:hypothetical protein